MRGEAISIDVQLSKSDDSPGGLEDSSDAVDDGPQQRYPESEHEQQDLFFTLNAIGDAVIATDTDGNISRVNPAAERLLQHSFTELVGMPLEEMLPLFHTEDGRSVDNIVATLIGGDLGSARAISGLPSTVSLTAADGTTVRLRVTAEPILGMAGRKTGAVLVLRDVTAEHETRVALQEREAALELLTRELESKNAELERFVYTVSHDLKSPLITIKGFAGMIAQDLAEGNTGSVTADFDRICTAADKMDTLLTDLLELSRVGRVVNAPEHIEFQEVVNDALFLLGGSLESRGVQVDVAPDLPRVYGDRTRLTEVVQNLVENAVKFLGREPNPRIEIGGVVEAEHVRLYIRDNGSGINPEYLTRVFTLFEQLDPGVGGSGMGLALIKRIVEIHGGEVWAESDGPGTGCTVHFTLPHAPSFEETDPLPRRTKSDR